MNFRPKKYFDQNERGASVIEFAVILPLVLIILFGILEVSLIFVQEHLVAGATREGVRIGIKANNFNCFGGKPGGSDCKPVTDRKTAVETSVKNYLNALFLDGDLTIQVLSPDSDNEVAQKILTVIVEADNFFPPLVSALVPVWSPPEKIGYTASGAYENSQEY
ncbi:MAG: hypothetical protein C0616_03355 [Desulfuromonas sp.]|nr:MAG: hypothetical protein C0616_03355 [Desulfuromonas sp.]